jgi:1-acyl-sn-glycerol-3-phosphate acyltransferase
MQLQAKNHRRRMIVKTNPVDPFLYQIVTPGIIPVTDDSGAGSRPAHTFMTGLRDISIGIARWIESAAVSIIYTPIILGAALVSRRAAYRLMRRWSHTQLRVFGIELEAELVEPLDEGRAYVFAHLNQTSLLESFIYPAMLPRPLRMVINIEFTLVPFVGQWSVAMGATVVVRQWPAQAKRALEGAIRRLKRGECYGISLEGRRSRDGRLSRYRKGAVVMAIEGQADLVPFYIEGARESWPYGAWLPQPGRIRAVFLRPINVAGLTYRDRDALVERLRDVAEEALGERPPNS